MARARDFKNLKQKGSSRQRRRAGLAARLLSLHDRAQEQVNRRGYHRQDGMTRQAAIAGTGEDFEGDFLPLSWVRRVLHWGFALLMIPFCFITIITMTQVSGEKGVLNSLWYSTEFVCFLTGVGSMISWFLAGILNKSLLYLYVLGHEVTHAAFIYACGGRVSGIHFSTDGGYVMTNKSNILIALSPYFVPFWSIVMILCHMLVGLFWEIPAGDFILFAVLGFTWTFHIIWTVWMIPKDQPDLKEHGTFFSLMIIILANLILLSVMICASSSTMRLSGFAFDWWNNFLDLVEGLWRLLPGPHFF